jgi:hypothetical protein
VSLKIDWVFFAATVIFGSKWIASWADCAAAVVFFAAMFLRDGLILLHKRGLVQKEYKKYFV